MTFICINHVSVSIPYLYVAIDCKSAVDLIQNGIPNVITLKDLCSFGVGGMPIPDDSFNELFWKKLKINASVIKKYSDIRDRVCNREDVLTSAKNLSIDCIEGIRQYSLWYILELYLKVHPIVFETYRFGFKVDTVRMYRIYNDHFEEYQRIKSNEDDNKSETLAHLKKMIDSYNPDKILTNGTICSHIAMIGTETFRMSSYDKNIFGLPKEYRQCLLPQGPNNEIVEIDMVSSHLVILAMISNETSIIDAFQEGRDIYQYLGSIFFQTDLLLTESERKIIKITMLMLLNGSGMNSLWEKLKEFDKDITHSKIKVMVDRLYSTLPNVKRFIDDLENAEEYVLSDGSRAWLGDIVPVPYKRISRVLQTLESIILWETILEVKELFDSWTDCDCRIFMTLHDSIYVECSSYKSNEVQESVTRIFKNNIMKRRNYNGKPYIARIKGIDNA